MKKTISLLLMLTLLCTLAPTGALAANKTFTLLVYLCGTDLESDGGMATLDLLEMIDSGVPEGDALSVVVQTGGTREWQNEIMQSRAAERWQVCEDGLYELEKLGRINMGDGDSLTDFLAYGMREYPADRYGLVLWDHGMGATGGVCYDEVTEDSLDMGEIYTAFSSVSKQSEYRKFSFVCFDACLMGGVEMALHIQPFADYMIASEELMPGTGLAYDSWVRALRDNPGISTEKLGQKIVDSFIQSIAYDPSEYGTLAVIALDKLEPVRTALERMGKALAGELTDGNLTPISRIRQNIRAFGDTDDAASDMIDLRVFAEAFSQFNQSAAKDLKKAIKEAVVYNGFTSNMSNISGLSVLVPSATRGQAETYLPRYDTTGRLPQYTAFLRGMVSEMSGGSYTFSSTAVQSQNVQQAQIDWFSQFAQDTDSYYTGVDDLYGSELPSDDNFSLDGFLNSLFGEEGSTQIDTSSVYGGGLWGDLSEGDNTDFLESQGVSSNIFGDIQHDASWLDNASITLPTHSDQQVTLDNPFADATFDDDAYVVHLSQDDLQHLASVEANLMMDVSDPDFECYVELGYVQDVSVDWKSGAIYGLFDGSWPHLDGQMVCIYDQVSNERYIRSLIPALINGDETYVLVIFDEENPGGTVVGTTEGYTDAGMPARGYTPLNPGDIITPMYELVYWDDNDEQQSEPFEGDPITVGKDATIAFEYAPIEEDAEYVYSFCLNDIYGEYQFTDFITLSF